MRKFFLSLVPAVALLSFASMAPASPLYPAEATALFNQAFVAGDYAVRWHTSTGYTTAKVTFNNSFVMDSAQKLDACLKLAVSGLAPAGVDEILIGRITNPVGPTYDTLVIIGAP